MRILYFSQVVDNITSFINSQVLDMSKTHEVLYVTCHKEEGANLFDCIEIPFEYSRLKQKLRNRLEHHDLIITFSNKKFAKKLNEVINSFKPDIIHIQYGYEALMFFDNFRNKENIPVLIFFRGYDASQKLQLSSYRRRLKTILSSPNVWTAFVCKALLENLRNYKLITERYIVLYSNVDTSFFKRDSYTKSDTFTFLQVSSFAEKKGHEYTVRAFQRFINNNRTAKCKLLFAGKKHSRFNSILSLTKALGIADKVDFVGETSTQETKKLFEIANVVILHSITAEDGDQEGIPNVLMEGMSMELPVISTIHSGIPELITSHENGILIKERDVFAYEEAINTMYHNWRYYPENREKICQKFERKRHIKELEEYYRKILGKGK